MIGLLEGEIIDAEKGCIIIKIGEKNNSIGYVVEVLKNTKKTLLDKKAGSLYIYESEGQNRKSLFGFLEKEQYTTFILLMSVPSVGPKKALSIMERLPAETLLSCIRQNDIDTMVSFGITEQLADRFVFNLRKKLKVEKENALHNDLIAALIALGYSRDEISIAIKDIKSVGIEKQIQEALKNIHKKIN